MRTITIFTATVAGIISIAFAYNSMREGGDRIYPNLEEAQSEATFRKEMESKLNKIAGDLQQYQQATQEQLEETKKRQDHLSGMVVDLGFLDEQLSARMSQVCAGVSFA